MCLSFSDGLARNLLQPLEDNGEDEPTGICYSVKIMKTERDITRF